MYGQIHTHIGAHARAGVMGNREPANKICEFPVKAATISYDAGMQTKRIEILVEILIE